MADATIQQLIFTVREENAMNREETQKNTSQIITLNKTFSEYFQMLKRQQLDELEAQRDAQRTSETQTAPLQRMTTEDGGGFGFLAVIAGVLAAGGALLVGFVDGFRDAVTVVLRGLRGLFRLSLIRPLQAIFTDININLLDKFKGLFNTVRGFRPPSFPRGPFLAIFEIFDDFGRGLSNVGQSVRTVASRVLGNFTLGFNKQIIEFGKVTDGRIKDFKTVSGRLGAVLGTLADIPRAIANIPEIRSFTDGVRSLGNSVRGLLGFGRVAEQAADTAKTTTGFFSRVGGLFRSLATALGPVLGVFRTLGRVIFFPLTVVMTIFDAIKGAVSGFEEGGIIGGILGAVNGIAKGLIALPLDLLKSAIGYVAGFFGFENVKAQLDSFSFENIFDTIFGSIMKGLEVIGSMFSNIFPAAKAAVSALAPGGEGPMEAFSRVMGEGAAGITPPNTSGSDINSQASDNQAMRDNGFLGGQSSSTVVTDASTNVTQTQSFIGEPAPATDNLDRVVQ